MPYRYLVHYQSSIGEPFYTNRIEMCSFENDEIAFDLLKHQYTYDGTTWNEIEEDHL